MRIQFEVRPIVTDRVASYVSRSACLSVTIVSPAKTVEPIEMLFEIALLPPRKGTQAPPLFGPCLLWRNGRPSQQLLRSCQFRNPLANVTVVSGHCMNYELWAVKRADDDDIVDD